MIVVAVSVIHSFIVSVSACYYFYPCTISNTISCFCFGSKKGELIHLVQSCGSIMNMSFDRDIPQNQSG